MPFLLSICIFVEFIFSNAGLKSCVTISFLYVDFCAGIGIGFTNIVERTTRASQELTRHEIEEGENWQCFEFRNHLFRIRIQHFRLNSNLDPVPDLDPSFS